MLPIIRVSGRVSRGFVLSRTGPHGDIRDGYQENSFVLRENQSGLGYKLIPPPHFACANCSAMRRWFLMQRLGVPQLIRAGQNCPYYQTTPDLTPSGQLSPQKSRHTFGSHTKTLRPIVSQTASEASPVLCLRELFKYSVGFGCVDYVFSFRGRAGLSGGKMGVYFRIEIWESVGV